MKTAILKAITPYVCAAVVIGCSFLGVHLSGYEMDMPSWWIGFLTAIITILDTMWVMRMIWGNNAR